MLFVIMLGTQARCNVINIGEADMSGVGKPELVSLHFTDDEPFNDLFVAAGVPEDELGEWSLFSGMPDFDLSGVSQFVVVKPEHVAAQLESGMQKGVKPKFNVTAASVVISAILQKVAEHEHQQKIATTTGLLRRAWQTIAQPPASTTAGIRLEEVKRNNARLCAEISQIILPRYKFIPEPTTSPSLA